MAEQYCNRTLEGFLQLGRYRETFYFSLCVSDFAFSLVTSLGNISVIRKPRKYQGPVLFQKPHRKTQKPFWRHKTGAKFFKIKTCVRLLKSSKERIKVNNNYHSFTTFVSLLYHFSSFHVLEWFKVLLLHQAFLIKQAHPSQLETVHISIMDGEVIGT